MLWISPCPAYTMASYRLVASGLEHVLKWYSCWTAFFSFLIFRAVLTILAL